MKRLVWVTLLCQLISYGAWAESQPSPVPIAPSAPKGAESSVESSTESGATAPVSKEKGTKSGKKKKSSSSGGSYKEAEGTQAPKRFEVESAIKSQYKLDGVSIEVDPD